MTNLKTFSLLIAWDDNDDEKGEFGSTVRATDAEAAEAQVRQQMLDFDRNEYGYSDEELAETEYGRVIECQEGAIWQAAELEEALRAIMARINGVYDDPNLVKFGPLGDITPDCLRIAKEALNYIDAI